MCIGNIYKLWVLVLAFILSACAAKQRPDYVHIPKSGEANAEIIFRATGISAPVYFHISEDTTACKNFSSLGYVFDHQREKYPVGTAVEDAIRSIFFVKKLAEVKEFNRSISADKPVQLQGYGYWSDGKTEMTCGPITSKFSPQNGAKYIADFAWDNGQCSLRIQDATDPSLLVKAPSESFNFCRNNE